MFGSRISGYSDRMGASKYRIRCVGGGEFVDDMTLLACPDSHDSLLRTEYRQQSLSCESSTGIFRYLAWLPLDHPLLPSGGPVTFRSKALIRELGLPNLTISFSGYYPERGAHLTSGSFKELEALPTLGRLQEMGGRVPVVASAGNTGRAFAEISARFRRPVVIVVPEKAIPRFETTEPADDVFLVSVVGDYSDAIETSLPFAAVPGCAPEGGARNVARRDGMGTVMLDTAVTEGRMPGHYFQAVGSGTGAIAVWEAAMRLRRDGRYGTVLPQLHLAQNEPFTPMVSAWQGGRREIIPDLDMPDARSAVQQVMSDVLTNRNPPYGIAGGVFDALRDTGGTMLPVSNAEGKEAMKLLRDTEGIDLDPAAAIATAALIDAVENGTVGSAEHILLNLTGGGYKRVREDYTMHPVEPALRVKAGDTDASDLDLLKEWLVLYG